MLASLRTFLAPVIFMACAGLVLSGCGRKGDLDVPGAPPTAKTDNSLSSTSTTPKPKPKVEDRPFILDPIL
jgi:predicted small lipoprotein YifL